MPGGEEAEAGGEGSENGGAGRDTTNCAAVFREGTFKVEVDAAVVSKTDCGEERVERKGWEEGLDPKGEDVGGEKRRGRIDVPIDEPVEVG